MNAFRSCKIDCVSGNYLASPHKVFSLKAQKDGKCVVTSRFEDSKPIIDPLLSADWTNVQEMLNNNINIPPIGTYIQSSLEDRSAVLDQGIDIIYNESQSTSEPTSEPISEPTPEINV